MESARAGDAVLVPVHLCSGTEAVRGRNGTYGLLLALLLQVCVVSDSVTLESVPEAKGVVIYHCFASFSVIHFAINACTSGRTCIVPVNIHVHGPNRLESKRPTRCRKSQANPSDIELYKEVRIPAQLII